MNIGKLNFKERVLYWFKKDSLEKKLVDEINNEFYKYSHPKDRPSNYVEPTFGKFIHELMKIIMEN